MPANLTNPTEPLSADEAMELKEIVMAVERFQWLLDQLGSDEAAYMLGSYFKPTYNLIGNWMERLDDLAQYAEAPAPATPTSKLAMSVEPEDSLMAIQQLSGVLINFGDDRVSAMGHQIWELTEAIEQKRIDARKKGVPSED